MTTTVQRGQSGALLRIPSGALRMRSRFEHALYFAVAFVDETSQTYYDSRWEWDDPHNEAGLIQYRLDVAGLNGAVAWLGRENRLSEFNLGIIKVQDAPDYLRGELKPPREPYPEYVFGNPSRGAPYWALPLYPTLDEFLNSIMYYAEGDTAPERPINKMFIDNSGSMTTNILQPGLRDYITAFGQPNISEPEDERWVTWFTNYIVDMAIP